MVHRRTAIVGVGSFVAAAGAVTCADDNAAMPQRTEDASSADAGDASLLDCVGVLHVPQLRGSYFANVRRYGKDNPALRERARLATLSEVELGDFCDWEACVRANGYNHACALNDAGVEKCRVCQDEDDCGRAPRSREDCVARARQPGRATCHVGILQECLIQRGARGFGDPRVTRTCWMSRESCAGRLPRSLVDEARAAQHETDQVIVEAMGREVDLADELEPDAAGPDGNVAWWRKKLSEWRGGLPSEVSDAGDFELEE